MADKASVQAIALDPEQKGELSTQIPTIMIVDDTPLNLLVLQRILGPEGFQTVVAEDGPSARALLERHPADLILLDIMMPGESGFETCSRLKANAATSEIPIIFLSALNDMDSKIAGLRAGAVDYIVKPFYAEEVLARVRVHLRIRETARLQIEKHRMHIEALRCAQESILVQPADYPQGHFSICFQPLEETSGDFYDVFSIGPEAVGYFVADISGHGVSAAFLTSAIKALLRQYSGPLYSPEDTLRGVGAVMKQMLGEEQYLTACFVRLNLRTRRLSVVNAGHPPVILVRASGVGELVEIDSDPLGMFDSAVLNRKNFSLAPGDRFFLYTDGLIEAVPGGQRNTGIERLVEACRSHHTVAIDAAAGMIAQALQSGRPAVADDLLLLAAEVV